MKKIEYPALKDRALTERFNDEAARVGRPPHLLLARIVRDYLDETINLAVCVDCHQPKADVQPYSRGHIRGHLCLACREAANYVIEKMAARAQGLPVVEQPEPYMWQPGHPSEATRRAY